MAQDLSTLQAAPRKRATKTTTRSSRAVAAQVAQAEGARDLRFEAAGILVWLSSCVLLLALISFEPTAGQGGNWTGKVGAWAANLSYLLFGLPSWALVPLGFLLGNRLIVMRGPGPGAVVRAVAGVMLFVGACALFEIVLPGRSAWGHALGGLLGQLAGDALRAFVGGVGGALVAMATLAIGWILLTGRSVVDVGEACVRWLLARGRDAWRAVRQSVADWRDESRARAAERASEGPMEAGERSGRSLQTPDLEHLRLAESLREAPRSPTPAREGRGSAHDDDRAANDASQAASRAPAGERDEPARTPPPPPVASAVPVVAAPAAPADRADAGPGGTGWLQERLRSFLDRTDAAVARSQSPADAIGPGRSEPAWADDLADVDGVSAKVTGATPEDASFDWSFDDAIADDLISSPDADDEATAGEAPASASDRLRVDTEAIVFSRSLTDGAAVEEDDFPSFDETIRLPHALPSKESAALDAVAAARQRVAAQPPAPALLRTDPATDAPPRMPNPDVDAAVDLTADAPEPMDAEPIVADGTSDAAEDRFDSGPRIVENAALRNRRSSADLERVRPERGRESTAWEYPPLSFLSYEEQRERKVDRDKLRLQATQLEEVLASFKVNGRVTNICPGPVVTRYEFEPEQGTKLSKISGLTDDVAMALKALTVRIIAPIPGKGCVGIEVPSDERETVYLKEILADDAFVKRASNKLTVALGKDIEGVPVVADLARMPHLLVAGTTGSGKSVSVNAMITSLLFNASPDDVRMIMIDPKQLEFAVYQDVPHLLLPVVTDPMKAAAALQWAVTEMDRRYGLMAEMRVRNLTGYNDKLRELRAAWENEPGEIDERTFADKYEVITKRTDDGRLVHDHMHYIVVIVDEFADLMMAAGKDVEIAVARLAQKARAAGIHVILATQRPSVDVLTGVIKSNFPTRMSFRLMSGTDSRTVLDTIGSENLLGNGDMLFRPPGASELTRVHGAYIDEREIELVVDFLKKQRMPEYDESILEQPGDKGDHDEDEPVDELYQDAIAACVEAGFASISMVQRKLRIGYNRSARIVERMERDGLVGPGQAGSGRREVLVSSAYLDI